MGAIAEKVRVRNAGGTTINPATDESLQAIAGLVPGSYNYIFLGYTGSDLTSVVYRSGGSTGTIVATLTLAYTGSRLDSITKTP